jgi:type I restriction enzyme S subunit
MKFITEVAKSYTGLTYKPENVSDSGTLVLRSSNINDDVLSFDDNIFVQMVIPERAKVQENDILICVRNGSKRLVGKSAMITKEAEGMAFGAFMTILRSFAINSKFLFYVWQSEKVRRQYKGDEAMPIAQITAKDFQRIVIPVPSLSEQKRIVSILDTFEASIQNLEAQLKQREKQYEYYRNKLLSFE